LFHPSPQQPQKPKVCRYGNRLPYPKQQPYRVPKPAKKELKEQEQTKA
jgi:hypothetical protein